MATARSSASRARRFGLRVRARGREVHPLTPTLKPRAVRLGPPRPRCLCGRAPRPSFEALAARAPRRAVRQRGRAPARTGAPAGRPQPDVAGSDLLVATEVAEVSRKQQPVRRGDAVASAWECLDQLGVIPASALPIALDHRDHRQVLQADVGTASDFTQVSRLGLGQRPGLIDSVRASRAAPPSPRSAAPGPDRRPRRGQRSASSVAAAGP